MITNICNNNQEHHLDVFYKIAVFLNSSLPPFDSFTDEAVIDNYITHLSKKAQVLTAALLPNNISVVNPSKVDKAGVTFKNAIKFLLTPQDKNLKDLLDTYNNKEVIVLLSKQKTSHLYGTSAQPLLFTYSPINNKEAKTLSGYEINLKGVTYGSEIIFEEITFNVYDKGLAFELAQSL